MELTLCIKAEEEDKEDHPSSFLSFFNVFHNKIK